MTSTPYQIPVLLIIFNRTEKALQTLEAIRKVRPRQIFIAADGPRNDAEKQITEKTRQSVVSAIDWDCEVKTLFQDRNLGCGPGVYTAVSWFFDNVEKGIVLEDDCVADPTFFQFAQEMLEKYENDERVGTICGYHDLDMPGYPYSWFFSRFGAAWGWASWRRAWKNMDLTMSWRDTPAKESVIANNGYHGKIKEHWDYELRCIDNGYVSAWDWQWYFTLAAQNQLCIRPKTCLISNVGNDDEATHQMWSSIKNNVVPLKFPLVAPPVMAPWEEFDRKLGRQYLTPKYRVMHRIPHSLKESLKKILSPLRKK